MQIPTWLYVLIFIGFIAGLISIFAWLLATLLEDLFAVKARKLFEEDLRLALKHSQPTWVQLTDIATSRNVKNADLYWVLQKLMREILTGRETDVAQHQKVVESYLAKHKEIEPFEGLPMEIRIHLERIKEQLNQDTLFLQPLTGQIRELLSVNEKDKRQQKYYTIGGFFVGFVGLIFAAFTYFYPPTNSNDTSASAEIQRDSAQLKDAEANTPSSSLQDESAKISHK